MNAGRELDALVAEKVMGKKIMRWMHLPNDHCMDIETSKPPSPYSTDIAAAWQVVEKVKEQNTLFYDFVMALGGLVSDDYDVFTRSEMEHLMFKLSPELICQAALYAVGYRERE